MSTAVAEPPPVVAATPISEPVATTPPQVNLESLLKPKITTPEGKVFPGAEPAKPVEKAPEKPADAAKDAPKQTDAERNFAALREKADAAEKRAAEHEARIKAITEEYETYKKNPVPKEYEERLTKAEKERQEYQQRLRVADLRSDPDFQRKFNEPIQSALDLMAQAAKAGGIDAKEVDAAIRDFNEEKFAEWGETMPPVQKNRLQAAMIRAIELDNARTAELADSDRALSELQKSRAAAAEADQKRGLETFRSYKKAVMDELSEKQEIFKGDPALQKEVGDLIDKVTGLNGEKMGAAEVISIVAKSQVLARHFQRVDKERGEHAAKIAELEKKLAEQESFIGDMKAGLPGFNPTPSGKDPKAETADIVNSLLHPTVKT